MLSQEFMGTSFTTSSTTIEYYHGNDPTFFSVIVPQFESPFLPSFFIPSRLGQALTNEALPPPGYSFQHLTLEGRMHGEASPWALPA